MITLTKSTNSFIYGKCVQIAVCEAFDEKMSTVDNYLLKTFGERDEQDGYTDKEVDIICKEMGSRNNVKVDSILLNKKDNINVMSTVTLLRGSLIITTDMHCLYVQDCVIYDSLMLIKPAFLFEKVTGIWSIKNSAITSNKKPFKDFLTIDDTKGVVDLNMNEIMVTATLINDLLPNMAFSEIRQVITSNNITPSPVLNQLLSNYLIV